MRGRVDALLHVIGDEVIGKSVEVLGEIVTAAPEPVCVRRPLLGPNFPILREHRINASTCACHFPLKALEVGHRMQGALFAFVQHTLSTVMLLPQQPPPGPKWQFPAPQ